MTTRSIRAHPLNGGTAYCAETPGVLRAAGNNESKGGSGLRSRLRIEVHGLRWRFRLVCVRGFGCGSEDTLTSLKRQRRRLCNPVFFTGRSK
jgi:hypothetical protein